MMSNPHARQMLAGVGVATVAACTLAYYVGRRVGEKKALRSSSSPSSSSDSSSSIIPPPTSLTPSVSRPKLNHIHKAAKGSVPPIVGREEWLVARRQLLVAEKELTRHRDEVTLMRRSLPWHKLEKGIF
jgi:hypothetical protein